MIYLFVNIVFNVANFVFWNYQLKKDPLYKETYYTTSTIASEEKNQSSQVSTAISMPRMKSRTSS